MGMVTVVFLDDLNMPAKEVRLACLEMLLFPWICSLPGTPTLPLAGALALPGNARLAHYLLTSRHTNTYQAYTTATCTPARCALGPPGNAP